MDDDVSLESIEGSEDDELEPEAADNRTDSIRSGGNRDDNQETESVDDER